MSLLDVLRYPISTPATGAQLMAVPHELIRSWLILVHWADDADLNQVMIYYTQPKRHHGHSRDQDIKLLRRMIYELA